MATPHTLNRLMRDKTPYQWVNEQLKLHGTITNVAKANGITRSAIYKMMEGEKLTIVQVVRKVVEIDA